MNVVCRLAALSALVFGLIVAASAAPDIGIGSPAPPIKVAKWIKGEPISGFAKGKVYVLEFWASW